MFKKFKDKLAEEVKSSPQRLQQFAQAAQAAVTSASSSISDITNNDLFSIGDSDSGSKSQSSTISQQNTFRDASPVYQGSIQSAADLPETTNMQEETQRQRRLSNSSLASDISFRLPSYESPSMYHLQSDMEVSASEAEEKGFTGVNVNLDRVTKEQLYSAYRRTQDRCKKYKTQYADLARHYKLLERENAKARNVLVETQDKALRRISELREQCSLEQSAKAHLERALRIEIDERNMKIHALNTKLDLLQNNSVPVNENYDKTNPTVKESVSDLQLINLNDNEQKESNEEALSAEILILNNKLEKMEQLLNKYKESLKVAKEKNAQMTTELQILTSDLQTKSKENDDLKGVSASLIDSKKKIQELNDTIEELQNKCNTYEFTKNKETSILEINLQSAQEDILQLRSKIEELKKKEEEYAISLAENKLSIHKELESKEAEIKSLKDSLTNAQNEMQSLHIVIDDYKNNVNSLEAEKQTLNSDIIELTTTKTKLKDMEVHLDELKQKCQLLENSKSKLDEQYKCLQLQMKQETAEKLAMIDRNTYLENRNAQLTEENTKKSSQIHDLENEIASHCNSKHDEAKETDVLKEISMWRTKYENLEREIQDEREELIKLQAEIEKLLRNYELVQTKNLDLLRINSDLKRENTAFQEEIQSNRIVKKKYAEIKIKVKQLRDVVNLISKDTRMSINLVKNEMFALVYDKISLFNEVFKQETTKNNEKYNELKINYDLSEKDRIDISNRYKVTTKELQTLKEENNNYKFRMEEYESEVYRMEQSAADQNKLSLEEIAMLKREVDNLKDKTENDYKHQLNIDECLRALETENNDLRDKLTESDNRIQLLNTNLQNEKELHKGQMQNAEALNKLSVDEISVLKREVESLKQKIENENKRNLNIHENIKTMEIENRNLQDKLSLSENNVEALNTNLQKQKIICEEKIKEIDALSINYADLIKENEENKNFIHKLQINIESLKQENLTLKNLSESISVNVNELETEMNEVRQSHAVIEREKDRLNNIIEQLESREHSCISIDKDSQTDLPQREKESDNETIHKEVTLSEEQKREDNLNDIGQELLEENITVQNYNPQFNNITEKSSSKTSVISDIETKYIAIQNEYEILKDENRRLQSDVEGLQIYLAKISKENSLLNDKLREYFASGENVPEKNEAFNNDIDELRLEIQSGKEKIDSLIRENTILEQENLELKDQIQSQSYNDYVGNKPSHNNNNMEQELQGVKDKYNNLMDVKIKLEKRLDDVEQMNLSVTENMQHMQVNNEKLRLSNEKLERRLDEALVSLRHLHSLQENTELEYLRNILYEYLTGSGTHSLTLAKVLSAVVKFSDTQTDLVLQKEKERQGFLRQMGLL